MKLPARALLALIPLLSALPPIPAFAQNVAAADALFSKGKEAMDKKNYKEACPAFRESYTLDPAPGALHALAVCHMEAGEIASAVVRFDEYLRVVEGLPPNQKAKHADRAKEAREQRAALAPEVPELTLVLPAEAPPGTLVTLDSAAISAVSLGVGLPIDPGEHVVTTQVPGGPVKEHPFTIKRSEKIRQVLTLEDAAPTQANSSRPKPSQPSQPLVRKDASNSGYRIGAFVVGGVGAAGLLGGVVAGAIVLGKKSIIDDRCSDKKCTAEGIIEARATAESAKVPGVISTVGFVVGAAGLAGATVLFLLEPSEKPEEGRGEGTIGMGITNASIFEWTAGVKGTW